MRNLLLAAGTAGLLGISSACGGDDPPPAVDGTGAKNGTGGSKSEGGADNASGGEEGGADSGGEGGRAAGGEGSGAASGAGGEGGQGQVLGAPPTVTVLSPAEVSDPLVGDVVVGQNVNVLCRALTGDGPDAQPVDPSTVKVAVLDASGELVAEKDAASTATAGEFEGEVPLTSVPTGGVGFRCSARSLGNALGSDEIGTFVDHGPTLTLDSPLDGAEVGLKDTLQVAFHAEPEPLVVGDTEAEVDSVELLIAGVPCPTTPVNGSPGDYTASVDLDGTSFNPKPNGNVPLTLKATNKRTPLAVSAVKNHQIFVDGVGPTITETLDKTVVGASVKLSFTVTDSGSGVNADSVTATLNTSARPYNPNDPAWKHEGDVFTYEFDSRNVSGSIVQITVKLEASDNVNNAALEKTLVLYLDHQPPKVDLDPRWIRIQKLLTPFHCSTGFDPVGDLAANDGADASGYDLFRALVWEQTNFIPNSPAVRHYAGTDPASVRLYFHAPGTTPALLINTAAPGTGTCNAIGDAATPLELTALGASGTPWYTVADSDNRAPACSPFNTSTTTAPPQLCGGQSDMHYVATFADGGLNESAIYVHAPSAGAECTGTAWEYRPFLNEDDQDGWVCLAAKAADTKGNVGVSPPLRLCVDPDLGDGEQPNCMAPMSTEPPSCTDGCTPPEPGGYLILLR
ncbi:MAG TPA: hypothetical protein VJN18_32050 [Polyangiaceae bacterium]|nr:hypothetical protein [Polyangiaceae bacterium]